MTSNDIKIRFPTTEDSEGPFQDHGGFVTAMAYSPRFDRQGRPLDPDPNTRMSTYTDLSTGQLYTRRSKGWITEFFIGEVAQFDHTTEPFLRRNAKPAYLDRDDS